MIILSPWQIISPYYIYIFFILTFLVGWIVIFLSLSKELKLFLLVLYAFVLVSYLPLSHSLLYGADQWRHIGSEAQILAGHWPQKPLLADGTRAAFGVGDISYGLFWLVSAGASKFLGLDLITIAKWLQPVLWAIAFPLVLWKLTEYFGWSARGRLFTIWFSNFSFALQAAGSFSLPVNFGFLFYFLDSVLSKILLFQSKRKTKTAKFRT
jgi:hypothetical protein